MPIALSVNGRKIETLVEPRTHLADFLREHCRLTGTHLGCEHGVCGACTVLIDDKPARSCITYAVQCDGSAVQTIEGFDNDPIMQELRAAFSREHGLQCGFCTSGMLIAARDIVQRLADADARRIRVELSGNLCRCTGYLGIVKAVESVIAARGSKPVSSAAAVPPAAPLHAFVPTGEVPPPIAAPTPAPEEARTGWMRFEESFVVARSPATVWAIFADIPAVVACLDGAELTEHDANTAKGKMTIKLGPIQAGFSGSAVIERDEQALRGIIRGAGSDKGTGSRTKGEIVYRLTPEAEGQQTRVSVTVEYSLQGALAQFSRSGLVLELGRRLVSDFAAHLNARLAGAQTAPGGPFNAGRFIWSWLVDWLRRPFGR
ncbi:MAG TPA: 2Fe-2S iron-sulfur cluster-binding protein [Xanthobacteraceae bacterium]|jgi:carbon-monoxide dehydrogenase small subunit|nr:2Fe-2S iron-sulfur cluster-binding protein [Xanthobacteraceae bacterium]